MRLHLIFLFLTSTLAPTCLTLRRSKRLVTSRVDRLWEDAVIPYEIDHLYFSEDSVLLINEAMRQWENVTCLQFIPRSPDDNDYVIFTQLDCGCCSYVGRRGVGEQPISLGPKCLHVGTIMHELGHAIGFFHEHTRPDRDAFVSIMNQAIPENLRSNFEVADRNQVETYGTKYDFESIMHYSVNSFSYSDGDNTIEPRFTTGEKTSEIGQRRFLSESDIFQVRKLYRCADCGATLSRSQGSFRSPRRVRAFCQWRIACGSDEHVEIKVTSFDLSEIDFCNRNYVEFSDGPTMISASLGRFCGRWKPRKTIISNGPRMLVTFSTNFNGIRSRGFEANYRCVTN